VLEIVDKEKPLGVIVQYGGQTPLKLALDLEANGVPIIGTSPDMIDAAEDRERFQKLLHELGLRQPPNPPRAPNPRRWRRRRPWATRWWCARATCWAAARWKSCTSSATWSATCAKPSRCQRLAGAAGPLPERRVECDVDCIATAKAARVIGGVMEHIEQAGVHSGDSACSLPPYSLSSRHHRRTQAPDRRHGQGAEGGRPDERAVRDPAEGRPGRHLRAGSEPARLAHRALREQGHRHPAGQGGGALHGRPDAGPQGVTKEVTPPYFSVKEAVFPFVKFPGVDTILGPEMKSTGEVMGVGKTFGEAFVKSQIGAGTLPRRKSGKVFISVKNNDKPRAVDVARQLVKLGFELTATKGTAAAINAAGIACATVNKVTEGRPHVVDMIKNNEIALVINTVEERRNAITDSRPSAPRRCWPA
jgi:carbamoyl-phosphate synthase large subunit